MKEKYQRGRKYTWNSIKKQDNNKMNMSSSIRKNGELNTNMRIYACVIEYD
jgi:hypothetical protein